MNLRSLINSVAAVSAAVLTYSQLSMAAPIVINDDYIGGGASDAGYATADVIGDNNLFGVSKMEVDLSAGQLSISVFSSYFNNVGKFGTDLGDLFIATSGWNPVGSSPYLDDKKSTTGTVWNYALVINHDAPGAGQEVDMLGTSGTVSLYQIPSQSLLQTANFPGYIYRGDQITKLDTTNLSPVAFGNWSISDVLGDEFDKLNVNIALSNFPGLSNFGLRWEMTCANDVIEGAASVPEPMTIGLLSLGLMGAGFRKRIAA
jgi:hypothetical protein